MRFKFMAVITLLLVALTSCSSDSPSITPSSTSNLNQTSKNATQTYLTSCVDDYVVKPAGIILTCADGGISIEKIVWRDWSVNTASGSGLYVYNDCDPDCADGTYHKVQVELSLGMKLIDAKNKSVFTMIGLLSQTDRLADGAYGGDYDLYWLPPEGYVPEEQGFGTD